MSQELVLETEDELVLETEQTEGYLLDVTWEKDNVVFWLYDDKTNKIAIKSIVTDHKPYLLTDMETYEHLNEGIKRLVTDVREIVKHDSTKDEDVTMLQMRVDDPLDIFNRRANKGLKLQLTNSWEDNITYTYSLTYDLKQIFTVWSKVDATGNISSDIRYEKGETIKDFIKKVFGFPIFVPRSISIDIEVYGLYLNTIEAAHEVLCLSLYSSDGVRKVLGVLNPSESLENYQFKDRDDNLVDVEVFQTETEMLLTMNRYIKGYPFVFTFNGDNYDLTYLYHREKNLGIPVEDIPIKVEVISTTQTVCRIKNAIHIDIFRMFRTSLYDYSYPGINSPRTLDNVSEVILKEKKIEHKFTEEEKFNSNLAEYCFNDARLTHKLIAVNDYINWKMLCYFARLYNLSLTDMTRNSPVPLAEKMFQWYHRLTNTLIPNKKYLESKNDLMTVKSLHGGKFRAAIISSKPGIYFGPIPKMDFASLYPTTIYQRNLSYETLKCNHIECMDNMVYEHDWWLCRIVKGIVAIYIGAIRDVRVDFRYKSKKDGTTEEVLNFVRAQALKMALLQQWGAISSDHFEYYLPAHGSATTAEARKAITVANRIADEDGYLNVYTHTDSMFLKPIKPKCTPKELAKKIVDELHFDIAVDKELKFVIVHADSNIVEFDKDGKPDVTGLVGKKSHTPKWIKSCFKEVSEYIGPNLNSEVDIEPAKSHLKTIIRSVVDKIKRGQVPLEELVYHVRLSKEAEEGKGQDYDVVNIYKHHNVVKRPGDYINKVLRIGSPSAYPMEYIRSSEINIEKYIESLYSTLDPLIGPLGLSRISIEHGKPLLRKKTQ